RGPDDVGLGGIDLERRLDTLGEELDEAPHLLGFVLALGERDAYVEEVRAALDLLAGDVDHALVVLRQEEALHHPRALGVDPFADQRGARLLDQVDGRHRARDARDAGGARPAQARPAARVGDVARGDSGLTLPPDQP